MLVLWDGRREMEAWGKGQASARRPELTCSGHQLFTQALALCLSLGSPGLISEDSLSWPCPAWRCEKKPL